MSSPDRHQLSTLSGPAGARPRSGAGELLLVIGEGSVQSFRLSGAETVIGRSPGCDVVVDHRMLSRRHLVLRLGPPASIQDLGSTNGTRKGHELLHGGDPVPLEDGESFHVGPFLFVLLGARGADNVSSKSVASGRLEIHDPTHARAPRWLVDIAAGAVNVIIVGETGVGKEVLAETVHRLSRRRGPLVSVNCAALSESLLEAELFGHEKGAFTGAVSSRAGLLESAQGGTVFLDELGELPLAIQAKLLRVIETREVQRLGTTRPIKIDVRFLAATNRDLIAEVAAGSFRQDLFYRLDGVSLHIPPLRERRTMIVPLALGFLEKASPGEGETALGRLSAEVVAMLEAHDWPGNIRELKAVIERAALLARGGEVRARHIALAPIARKPTATTEAGSPGARPPSSAEPAEPWLSSLSSAELAERARILQALEQHAGNQSRAAQALGISRTTLVQRLLRFRIPRPRAR
jgi:DNA-binding NtrC family response regulator